MEEKIIALVVSAKRYVQKSNFDKNCYLLKIVTDSSYIKFVHLKIKENEKFFIGQKINGLLYEINSNFFLKSEDSSTFFPIEAFSNLNLMNFVNETIKELSNLKADLCYPNLYETIELIMKISSYDLIKAKESWKKAWQKINENV